MDSLFGIVGDGFVLLAADQSVARSILTYKHDEDKLAKLEDTKVLGGSGETADRLNFTEYLQKNLSLLKLRNDDLPLDMHSTAHYIRTSAAEFLRSRTPYQCNFLLGGVDGDGAALYFIDYLGTLCKMNFAAHGHCANFIFSIFDRYWKPRMTEAQALELARACIGELHRRFLINQPNYKIKIVSKTGTKEVTL